MLLQRNVACQVLSVINGIYPWHHGSWLHLIEKLLLYTIVGIVSIESQVSILIGFWIVVIIAHSINVNGTSWLSVPSKLKISTHNCIRKQMISFCSFGWFQYMVAILYNVTWPWFKVSANTSKMDWVVHDSVIGHDESDIQIGIIWFNNNLVATQTWIIYWLDPLTVKFDVTTQKIQTHSFSE